MKLAFVSNFMNHHQRPLSLALAGHPDVDYRFIATEPFTGAGVSAGYRDMNREDPFILRPYESEAAKAEALAFCRAADVVIIGSAPDEYIEDRLRENKLTFRYCERFFKNGRWRILDPRVFLSRLSQHTRYRNKNLYMLCASAYTAPDCRFIRAYPNKTYKWGYFPPVTQYKSIDAILQNKKKNSLLWVARMIPLKHPEAPLEITKRLADDGYNFELNFIGQGELEEKIKTFIEENDLSDRVHLLGSMSPEEVRTHMEQSEIFLFTSDRNEGWGAVLNESMNSACAVVASRAIGSVPFLLHDRENGLVYEDGDLDDLYEKVKYLLDHPTERTKMGKAAYRTLTETWNAESAAARLLKLIDALQDGKDTPYTDGPCSRAE